MSTRVRQRKQEDKSKSVRESHYVRPFLVSRIPLCCLLDIRPFLMQSDSASRKRPFSTGIFFDWIILVLLLIVSRVDFIVFVLFLEAVGVREYCCTAVEIGWQLCASRFLRKQRLGEPSSQRIGGFGLGRKPPKLRWWSCTQPRAVKATAAAAVVGSMGSSPRAAAVV